MALVSVPKTSLVKVVCGISFGSSPIGATVSPVDGKLLLLQEDGNADIGPPQPICLPATMVEEQMVAMMTETQFLTALTTKGVGYTYPLLNWIVVTTTEGMMQIAPIPLHLLYNTFDNDLDAVCVLERVILVNPTETDDMKHLKHFLCVCLTAHDVGDKTPYAGERVPWRLGVQRKSSRGYFQHSPHKQAVILEGERRRRSRISRHSLPQ